MGGGVIFVRIALAHRLYEKDIYNESENVCIVRYLDFTGYPTHRCIFSPDKEWMIGESGINNICDVMRTVENDDSRGFGAMMTLPLFFPFLRYCV